MKLWVQVPSVGLERLKRGPLVGYETPYVTKNGFPVGFTEEEKTFVGGLAAPGFKLARPGMVLISLREDMLYAIVSGSDAVPLNVRVELVEAGVRTELSEASS